MLNSQRMEKGKHSGCGLGGLHLCGCLFVAYCSEVEQLQLVSAGSLLPLHQSPPSLRSPHSTVRANRASTTSHYCRQDLSLPLGKANTDQHPNLPVTLGELGKLVMLMAPGKLRKAANK
ncbi:hypothetical protein ATANTOWER_013824 [Ataeniobius toweri]|uniref:Uncharacterized protein n=1 Tax=Ataeniobius toweri TaxID=208326 RepID=A0ABU7BBF0_9TELE|nr:hypothetical protein [Ataeniobius toweri]